MILLAFWAGFVSSMLIWLWAFNERYGQECRFHQMQMRWKMFRDEWEERYQ